MKKLFESPVMEVVEFEVQEIVTTTSNIVGDNELPL